MAGIINYALPVENASGKIFGKKNKWMAVTRKVGKKRNGCAVMGMRSSAPSISELAHRQKFAAVAAAARERMTDPMQNPEDQVGFVKQSKYPTFYGYIFSLEWAKYEE